MVGDTFYDLTIDQTGYGETKATTKSEGAYTEDDYTLYGFPSVIYDGVTGALLNVINNNRFTDTENVQYTITREGDVSYVNRLRLSLDEAKETMTITLLTLEYDETHNESHYEVYVEMEISEVGTTVLPDGITFPPYRK